MTVNQSIKKAVQNFRAMSKGQKTEAVIASVLTIAFLTALPVYAWFSKNKNLETITKIKEPGDIIIRSGKSSSNAADEADPIVNFELQDIDIESIKNGVTERRIFSVTFGDGDYSQPYHLVLAHTTNIPFVYTLYHAEKVSIDGMTNDQIAALTEYTPRDNPAITVYYQTVGDAISMTNLNYDDGTAYGREIADPTDEVGCYGKTYEAMDNPEVYAVPVYSRTTSSYLHPNNAWDNYDYYILDLSWDTDAVTDDGSPYAKWNKKTNNKETDMIYITATTKFTANQAGGGA